MSQKVKRVLNAFVLGFVSSAFFALVNTWVTFSKALSTSDWASLKTLGFSLLSGAVLAALRAIQAYVPIVPSPEAGENNPK